VSEGALAVGIDVGGTKIAALRVDRAGNVLARDVRPTPARDQVATLAAMGDAAEAVCVPEVAAVGISAAGLVEWPAGVMRFAPNLSWRDLALVDEMRARLGVPVVADNDNNCAGWGEFRYGSAAGQRDVLFVGVGTGIGGGIILGGRLFRGAHGFAAEIGHIIVEPGGPPCGCGNRGCWEQVASGHAISRDGQQAVARHPHSLLVELSEGDPEKVTGSMVTQAARAGDAVATGIVVEAAHRLGEGIAGLVNVLDPDIVAIGGGVSEAGDLMLEPARAAFTAAVEGVAHRPEVPLVLASLGNDAGGIGAAALAFDLLDGVLGAEPGVRP
jgi:glucokinase